MLELVGFFGDISRGGRCCALPNVAICAKIAIGTWKEDHHQGGGCVGGKLIAPRVSL